MKNYLTPKLKMQMFSEPDLLNGKSNGWKDENVDPEGWTNI